MSDESYMTLDSGLASPAVKSNSSASKGGIRSDHNEAYNPVQAEQAIWRSVIVQALMDASCGSQKPEAQQAKREALVWLRGNSQDFATVCYYAGFEPEYVKMMAARSLGNGCQWRALPGKGTRKRTKAYTNTGKPYQRR